MMKKFFCVAIGLLMTGYLFGGAANGNCQAKAVTLSTNASKSVKLVDEWDSDIGEYWGDGVYYYKVTLTKNQPYTIWITGGNAADIEMSVYTDTEDESAPAAVFDPMDFDEGAIKAAYLYQDSWWDDDPNKGTFYICLSGEIGSTTTIYVLNGIQGFTKEGEDGNPKRISITTATQSHSSELIDGSYYYISSLTGGLKYRFLIRYGSSQPLSLSVEGGDYAIEVDPAYTNLTDRIVYLVYPKDTADYVFCVSSTYADSISFSTSYYAFKTRLPEQHYFVDLNSSDDYRASVMPGRIVADADTYYDAVIDESLCRIAVSAGERWVIQTSNATSQVEMRAYDASGKILNTNTSLGNGSFDCRTAFAASYDGYYYIGVCNPMLDVMDEPVGSNVVVFARRAEDFNGPDDSDIYDTLDDTFDGASMIVAYPGKPGDSVSEVGEAHGPHVLSGGDWYDWYRFAGRNGVTYAIRASFAATDVSDVALNCVLYKYSSGVRTRVTDVRGSLIPEEVSTTSAPLTFTADEDAMYYLCVYAGTGGHDYPAYNMHAMCYCYNSSGSLVDVGLVQVNTKGVESTWAFSKTGYYYPSGTVVAAPAGKDFTVGFASVDGYKVSPGSLVTNVTSWIVGESEDVTQVTGVFTDVYDHGDDVYTGYVRISPEHATGKANRTLWVDDPEDNFLFKATEGLYYNFELVDSTQDGAGDAVMTLCTATVEGLDSPLFDGVTELLKKKFDAGNYLIKVSHENPTTPVDTAYTLSYNTVNVGTLQFVDKSVTVSEDAAYAEIKISRSASEGVVRLNWNTEAYTAKPGSEYYPANGILEWADGDMETKTIKVRLIPDLKEEWDSTLYFAVNIWAMPEDCWQDNEYGAVISGATKIAVKLAESSQKNPGMIVIRNQSLATVAGEPLKVILGRDGGTDGDVGVIVASVAGTAVRGVDFDKVQTNIVWFAGDAEDKVVTIGTAAVGSLDEKTFSLKFGSLKTVYPAVYPTYDDPALDFSQVNATIASELVSRTLDEVSAAVSGVDMSTMAGVWYGDALSPLRSEKIPVGGKVAFKFHVSEPGFFVVHPQLENALGDSSFLYQVSGQEIKDCSANERMVLKVPNGGNIAFVARCSAEGAYVTFADVDGTGNPCKWIPLSSVTPKEPLDGSVIAPLPSKFSWNAPANQGTEELWYRVKVSAKSSDTCAAYSGLTVPDTDTTCYLPKIFTKGHKFWWTLEMACRGDGQEPEDSDWVASRQVWSFTTSVDGAPKTVPEADSRDVNGELISSLISAGKCIELVQGARIDFNLVDEDGSDVTSVAVIDGTLPPGTKIVGNRYYGVPKTPGDYTAQVQVFNGSIGGISLPLAFHVAEIGTAAGSFCGVLKENGYALPQKYQRLSALSFSVTEAGILTGKAKINGVQCSFTSSGYVEVVDRDDTASGKTMKMVTTMNGTVTAANGTVYTNVLEVSIGNGALTNLVALGETAGTAKMSVDGRLLGSDSDFVDFTCELIRNNAAVSEFVNALSPFAGYYTAAFVPFGVSAAEGMPAGNGVAALTVGDAGSCKFAMVLADRTSCSSAAYVGLKGDLAKPEECVMLVPLIASGDAYSVGGLMEIKYGETTVEGENFNASYIDSLKTLEWNKGGSDASLYGDPISIEIRPTGGWYDTVANLQRYYLDRDFTVEYYPIYTLPSKLMLSGYTFTADTTPHDVAVNMYGNTMPVADRQIVKNGSLVDFDKSVNAWNVTLNFNRNNGLVQGTAMVVSDGSDEQIMLGTVNHYGILLMNRDSNTPLDADVWTAGFYQFPAYNKWKMSLPFNIKAVQVDRDWSETTSP